MSETALKPANENPWYVLMTLYGEQTGEEVDEALHEKNKAAWNAWAALGLTQEQRAEIAKSTPLREPGEWGRKAKVIEELHRAEMVRRNGEGFVYPGFPDVEARIELSSVVFQNPLVSTGLIYARDALFNHANFSSDALFDSVIFYRQVWFDSARFSRDSVFGFAMFGGQAWFESAEFIGAVWFGYAKFSGDAWFAFAEFRRDASFGFATFKGDASFSFARFGGNAWFDSSTFSEAAGFSSTVFRGYAAFGSVTFGGDARFGSAMFGWSAWFGSAVFSKIASFQATKFGNLDERCVSVFSDCQFQKPTNFRETVFSRYPNFAGSILHDKTTFTDDPAFWPQGPQPDPAQAKASCATIRHNLGKQGLPEAEHFFYRREMEFAGQIGGWWWRLPYRVFGWLSDYGYAIDRPSWALFWVWLVPSFLFTAVWIGGQPLDDLHDLKELGRGAALSFANLFTIFGLHKLWFSAAWLEQLWWPLKVLGGVQTVLSLPLLFFLGLGLRTRFRLR